MSNHHLVNRPNRRGLRIDGPGGSILITRSRVFTPCHRLSRSVVNAPFVLLFGRDLIGNGIKDFTGTNGSLIGSSGLFGDLGDGGFLTGNGGAGAPGWPVSTPVSVGPAGLRG
jgi:hypothetical protein